MSRCVIIGGGPYSNTDVLADMVSPDDTIIAADSGWELAMKMHVNPSVLVADFDSMTQPQLLDDVKVVRLPIKKDDTDTAVAMREGYDAGFRSFLLLGCTGGRLDHYFASLTIAAQYAVMGCEVVIADEKNLIRVLHPGDYTFGSVAGEIVSLFAFAQDVVDLSVDHLEYDIKHFTLSPLNPLCVSNAATGNEIRVRFSEGVLLLHFSKD